MSKHHVSTSGKVVVCTASKKACPRGGHAEMSKEQAKTINGLPPKDKAAVLSLLDKVKQKATPSPTPRARTTPAIFNYSKTFAKDKEAFEQAKQVFMQAHDAHKNNTLSSDSRYWKNKRAAEEEMSRTADKLARTEKGRGELERVANDFRDIAKRQNKIRDERIALAPAAGFDEDFYPDDWDSTLAGDAMSIEDSINRGKRCEQIAEQASKAGFGQDARSVPVAEVRRALPVGQKLTTTYALPGRTFATQKQVTETNNTKMITRESDGSNPTVMDWRGTSAYKDNQGNYLCTNEDNTYWLAFTPEKSNAF